MDDLKGQQHQVLRHWVREKDERGKGLSRKPRLLADRSNRPPHQNMAAHSRPRQPYLTDSQKTVESRDGGGTTKRWRMSQAFIQFASIPVTWPIPTTPTTWRGGPYGSSAQLAALIKECAKIWSRSSTKTLDRLGSSEDSSPYEQDTMSRSSIGHLLCRYLWFVDEANCDESSSSGSELDSLTSGGNGASLKILQSFDSPSTVFWLSVKYGCLGLLCAAMFWCGGRLLRSASNRGFLLNSLPSLVLLSHSMAEHLMLLPFRDHPSPES